jgi:hypothetical protein
MVPFIVDEESQASVRWEKVAYEAKVDYTRQRNEMILPPFACYQCLFAPAWRWRDSRAGEEARYISKVETKKGRETRPLLILKLSGWGQPGRRGRIF